MAELRNIDTQTISRADSAIDQGLRSYMLGVYNLMAIGLVITAVAALAVVSIASTTDPSQAVGALRNGKLLTQFGVTLYTSPLAYVVMFAPLVAVFFLSFRISSLSTGTARMLFIGYAALVGISLSSIFLRYAPGSVIQVFMITAVSFGALSLYGYTTKRDLSGMRTFLFMGVIGLIVAMIVNMFLGWDSLQFAISVIGVGIFAGLTAYDTQNIKEMYFEGDSSDAMGRKIVMGALNLYLDFINMFVFLLQLIGNRD